MNEQLFEPLGMVRPVARDLYAFMSAVYMLMLLTGPGAPLFIALLLIAFLGAVKRL